MLDREQTADATGDNDFSGVAAMPVPQNLE